MNQGAEMLRNAGPTGEIAHRLGVSSPLISNLRNGKAFPSKKMREKLLSELSIPLAAWDRPLEEEPAPITQRFGTRVLPSQGTSVEARVPLSSTSRGDDPGTRVTSSGPEAEPSSTVRLQGPPIAHHGEPTERPIPGPSAPFVASPTPASSEAPPLPPKPALVTRVPPSLASLPSDEEEPISENPFEVSDRPARAELTVQIARLRKMVRDPNLTGTQRVQMEAALTRALRYLAEMSGELKPSDLKRVLLSPDFQMVVKTVFDVLKRRCPEAIPEITEALGALDREHPDTAREAA